MMKAVRIHTCACGHGSSLLQVDSFFTSLARVAKRLGVAARVAHMGRGDDGWDERFHHHVEEEASR